MTGGQDAVGALSMPALTRSLQAEGVARIIVTTEDRSRYKGVRLAQGVDVWDRSRYEEAQRVLADDPGRHRPDPRPGVRGPEAPQAQARHDRRPEHPRDDQRARLRGLRRLRADVELPVGHAGRHRVRPQDPHPPGVVQQGLLLPRRRLPGVPDRRARVGALGAGDRAPRPRRVRDPAGAGRPRRVHRAARGDRRHRGDHGVPGARHRRARGRAPRARPRPDGPRAEGRRGRLRRQDQPEVARGGGPGGRGRVRPLPRRRPAGRRGALEPRHDLVVAHGRRDLVGEGADRRDGRRPDGLVPGRRRGAEADHRADPEGRRGGRRRPRAERGAVR